MSLPLVAVFVLAQTATGSPDDFPVRRAPVGYTVAADGAEIVNSGSTNTAAYRIAVAPDGTAHALVTGMVQTQRLPAALATRFFEDLRALQPLDAVPMRHCFKSASFGTATTVRWNGHRSGDLSCGGGSNATLNADVAAVVNALHIDPLGSRRIRFRGPLGGGPVPLEDQTPPPASPAH